MPNLRTVTLSLALPALLLGVLVWNPNDVHTFRNAGLRLACSAGEGRACVNHGVQYGRGDGVAQDYATAAKYYRKACDLGVPEGCSYFGDALVRGRGVQKDYARAAEYQEIACDADIFRACSVLGLLYYKSGYLEEDWPRAENYSRRACVNGWEAGCETLAGMAISYYRGEDTAVDKKGGARLFAELCFMDRPDACFVLGLIYKEGEGMKPNPEWGDMLISKACDDGEDSACEYLAKTPASRDGETE